MSIGSEQAENVKAEKEASVEGDELASTREQLPSLQTPTRREVAQAVPMRLHDREIQSVR